MAFGMGSGKSSVKNNDRADSMPAYEARYSKLLGAMYLVPYGNHGYNPEAILNNLPDPVRKAGYVKETADALIKQIESAGGKVGTRLEGELKVFRIRETEKGFTYARATFLTELPDAQGNPQKAKVVYSPNLKTDVGLTFLHKLANAEFGQVTEVFNFPKVKEKDGRTYVDHMVGMKQNGQTVKPELPFSNEQKKALREKLKAEGEEKDIIPRKLIKAELDASGPQIEALLEKSAVYYEEQKASGHVIVDDEYHSADVKAEAKEETLPNQAAKEEEGQGDDEGEDFGFSEGF